MWCGISSLYQTNGDNLTHHIHQMIQLHLSKYHAMVTATATVAMLWLLAVFMILWRNE
jgi:hypothetical protein